MPRNESLIHIIIDHFFKSIFIIEINQGETMARLNIEDQFWLDVLDIVTAVGNQDAAIGNAIRFLRFAQEKHKQGKLISEDEFKAKGFSDALIPLFAKRTPSGIQANGAEKYFAWLNQKYEAGSLGGKKSAKRPRDKQGRLLPKTPQLKNTPSELQPSSSYSYSSSYSSSSSCRVENLPEKSGDPASVVSTLGKLRAKLHNEVHGVDPIKGAQVNGMLSNLVKEVGRDEAPKVLELFYRKPNNHYKTRAHDLKLLLSDKAALLTEVRRQAPIIPDGREKSFKEALQSVSRQDEIKRHFGGKS